MQLITSNKDSEKEIKNEGERDRVKRVKKKERDIVRPNTIWIILTYSQMLWIFKKSFCKQYYNSHVLKMLKVHKKIYIFLIILNQGFVIFYRKMDKIIKDKL